MANQEPLLLSMLLILLLTLIGGLIRAIRGPTLQDRMMSVQLLGTGGVGVLLLLAAITETPPLLNVALVLALLAAVSAVAVTSRGVGHD